ncbi:MAG: glutathione S-transferase family protein [Myxococcales bacterium]
MRSLSPYCWKVEMALVAKGIDYEVFNTLNPKSANPLGKLPYLELDGRGYEDSTHIIRTIDAISDHGPRLIPRDPALASEADVWEDWADESLYWHGFRAKFVDDQGWSRLSAEMVKLLPAQFLGVVAKPLIRRDLQKKIAQQGLTRRSPEIIDEEIDRHLDSLEMRLSDRDYLVGGELSIADLAVTAMIGQLTVGLTPPVGGRIAKRSRLSAFLRRVFDQTAPPLE